MLFELDNSGFPHWLKFQNYTPERTLNIDFKLSSQTSRSLWFENGKPLMSVNIHSYIHSAIWKSIQNKLVSTWFPRKKCQKNGRFFADQRLRRKFRETREEQNILSSRFTIIIIGRVSFSLAWLNLTSDGSKASLLFLSLTTWHLRSRLSLVLKYGGSRVCFIVLPLSNWCRCLKL